MKIPKCDIEKSGIPKIEIPVPLRKLDAETIKLYLPYCIGEMKKNATKIRWLKRFVDGSYQEIDDRPYEQKTSGKAKNRIKENHAYEIVQFKEGFRSGNKRQLVNKEGVDSNEVSTIELFMSDIDAPSKIMEWVHDLYSTGIGTTFIQPRGDIFDDEIKVVDGEEKRVVTYKKDIDDYDVNINSPFVYETVNSEENAVVYSSCIGESGLKDLFCINIANVRNKQTNRLQEVATVYTRDSIYEYKHVNGKQTLERIADNSTYGCLPMTEHSLNKTRISPIEVVYDMLNAVNLLLSLETNSVEDKVNQLLIFLNVALDQDDIDDMYDKGIILLAATGGTQSPDVKTISNDLKFTETSVLMERVLTRMFDIVGVPLASATVSSGNNEAAYLGGGWTNANIVMNRDIVYSERSEREELRKIIKICKLNSENPVQKIQANQIEIKYNINQSNNYLAKTQAMQNLNDMGVDMLDIFKVIPLFGDEEGVARRCKENQEAKQKREEQLAEKQQDSNGEQPTGDNLTGQQKQQTADQTTAQQAKGAQ